jgi:hypothetical protein
MSVDYVTAVALRHHTTSRVQFGGGDHDRANIGMSANKLNTCNIYSRGTAPSHNESCAT